MPPIHGLALLNALRIVLTLSVFSPIILLGILMCAVIAVFDPVDRHHICGAVRAYIEEWY